MSMAQIKLLTVLLKDFHVYRKQHGIHITTLLKVIEP